MVPSAGLEFPASSFYFPFRLTPNALPPLTDHASLVVPAVTMYEVFKAILRESNENEALQAVTAMQKGTVVDLTAALAIAASKVNLDYNLPMVDSIILATAREFDATIWTQDSDFKDITNVKHFPKKQKTGRGMRH